MMLSIKKHYSKSLKVKIEMLQVTQSNAYTVHRDVEHSKLAVHKAMNENMDKLIH